MTKVIDPLGFTTTYARDSAGYVTQVTFADGSTQTSQYQSAFHALTTFTDQRNNTTTSAYDGQGHLTSQTDPLGAKTTLTYLANGLLQSMTDPNNHTTTSAYDSDRRLTLSTDALGNKTTFSYDANGNPLTTVDARGNTTTTAFDVMGRLTQSIDPLGDVTTLTYNAAGLELTRTDPDGNLTSLVYDGFGQGLVVQGIGAAGSTVQTSNVTNYDAAGHDIGDRNAAGWTTGSRFDPAGRPVATSNPLSGVATSVYDLAGQVVQSADELGRPVQQAYNARGWLTQSTDALGEVTTFAYDQAGNRTAVTDPAGHTVTTVFDKDNRPTVVTDARGFSTTTVYDAAGNVSSVTDANGHVTSYVYNADDELVSETDAVGTPVQRTVTFAYDPDGNRTAVTDGLGHTTTTTFDKDNRVVAVTDPLGHTATTVYDPAGNVVQSVDALGNVTTTVFDALNQPVAVIDPLGHTTTVVYDGDGRAVATIDALGHVTQTVFDAVGRPVATVDARGGVTQTLYDAAGNVAAVIDSVGNQTSYVADGLGRTVQVIDPLGHVTTTVYNSAGLVSSVTDADGRSITYSYDANNEETGATWKSSTNVVVNTLTFSYDNVGNQLTAANSAGTYTLGYDARNRVTSQSDPWGLSLTNSYDAADRRTQRQDSLGGVLTSVYDNADRLTSRQLAAGTQALRIDPGYNNRNDMTSLTRYADTGNRLSTDGTWTYTYDNVGNQLTKANGTGTTWTYGYDNLNHLTSATETISGVTTLVVSYSYDVFGDLIQEQHWTAATGTVTLRHAYDGTNAWADLDTSNTVKARYVYGEGADQVFARMIPTGQTNAGVAWYLTDRLGSLTDLMDGTQALKDHLDYSGYGVVTECNPGFGDAYKYADGRTDSATGLVQFGERWYNPATGRWLSQDPTGFAAGDSNLYRYVSNEPTSLTDPSGLGPFNNALLDIPPQPTSGPGLIGQVEGDMQRRSQIAANGGTPPPLMWGTSVRAYGMDGNQYFAGAMVQAGQMTMSMTRWTWRPFEFIPGPVGWYARGVGRLMDATIDEVNENPPDWQNMHPPLPGAPAPVGPPRRGGGSRSAPQNGPGSTPRKGPGMAPQRVPGMASGSYQSPSTITDFTTQYNGRLNTVVQDRMRRLGVPNDMIGIRNYPGLDEGPFTRFPSTQIGGNVNPNLNPGRQAAIALDHGIFDAAHPRMAKVPSWRRATVQDRMDAAIVHEYIEATLKPPSNLSGPAAADWLHNQAVRRAPYTQMPITRGARWILKEYRIAEGRWP